MKIHFGKSQLAGRGYAYVDDYGSEPLAEVTTFTFSGAVFNWTIVTPWHVELDPMIYHEEVVVLMCCDTPMMKGRFDDIAYFNSLCEDLNKVEPIS